MTALPRRFVWFALAIAAAAPAAAASLPATELFPVEPGVNAERGFAVAVSGLWLAVGAPRDDEANENAGAVYLFKWSGATWDQKKKLFADASPPNAQLGFSLALHDGVLAAGAPGEGAVYIFRLLDEDWKQDRRLTGTEHGLRAFGRSLALDGDRLAVGAVGAHGATAGAVYLYDASSWDLEQTVRPKAAQPDERFGSAVALAGGVLVVGAPGYGDDIGAAYVFQRGRDDRWREQPRLLRPDSPPLAGQQFGFAVATDRMQIFVGAPTADPASENSGAVYRFVRDGKDWKPEGLPAVEVVTGAQLGYSLALSEHLLVASAPTPPPGRGTGEVLVFQRSEGLWLKLAASNAETHDLAGFAVAVDGRRLVVGGVLGDQGDAAAGAAWSFLCPGDEEDPTSPCSEAEAVAHDHPKTFGRSVAVTESFLAVGAEGVVYLSRRAGSGWRQQQRLTSRQSDDGFGASVALAGSLLAVGAPQAPFSSVSPPTGAPRGRVDLYAFDGSSWVFETSLRPLASAQDEMAFGASIAIDGGAVAVGAPGSGTVHLFQKESLGWIEISVLASKHISSEFGTAVSLHGGVLAIGAPGEIDGAGAAYIARNNGNEWHILQRLERSSPFPERLGSSITVGDGVVVVGSPGFAGQPTSLPGVSGDPHGAVRVFEQLGTCWEETLQIVGSPRRLFGASVSLEGSLLAVGAPGKQPSNEQPSKKHSRVALFRYSNGKWEEVNLGAPEPLEGAEFGSAVALSKDFLVVTSPGKARGDRVTLFVLPDSIGGDP